MTTAAAAVAAAANRAQTKRPHRDEPTIRKSKANKNEMNTHSSGNAHNVTTHIDYNAQYP